MEILIKIVDKQCDTDKMDMPSFQNFKINLESVIKASYFVTTQPDI